MELIYAVEEISMLFFMRHFFQDKIDANIINISKIHLFMYSNINTEKKYFQFEKCSILYLFISDSRLTDADSKIQI